jgi:hypothetical protein
MERAPLLGAPRPVAAARRLAAFSPRGYATVLLVLVLFNVADNVLVVVLFDEFPEELAQYVNQGTALVYIVWCSAILLVRKRCRKRRTLPTAGGLRSTCFVVVVAPPGARPLSLFFFRSLCSFILAFVAWPLFWRLRARGRGPLGACWGGGRSRVIGLHILQRIVCVRRIVWSAVAVFSWLFSSLMDVVAVVGIAVVVVAVAVGCVCLFLCCCLVCLFFLGGGGRGDIVTLCPSSSKKNGEGIFG